MSSDGLRGARAEDELVKVWNVAKPDFDKELSLKGHKGPVIWVWFSADSSRILTTSEDKTVKVRNASSDAESFTLKGHTDLVWSVLLSPDGSRIVTPSCDGTVKLWDPNTSCELFSFKGRVHKNKHLRVASSGRQLYCSRWSTALSPDGSRIVTTHDDGTVMIGDSTPINREILSRESSTAARAVK